MVRRVALLGLAATLAGAVAAGLAAMPACYDPPRPVCGFRCGPAGECPGGYACNADDGRCHLEGSEPTLCAVLDAAVDVPQDAAPDVAIDAAIDAPPDAPIDAPLDAAIDAPPDAAIDAPPDAAIDAAIDPRPAARDRDLGRLRLARPVLVGPPVELVVVAERLESSTGTSRRAPRRSRTARRPGPGRAP